MTEIRIPEYFSGYKIDKIVGYTNHNLDIITLQSTIYEPADYKGYDYDVEDILNHEILHTVIRHIAGIDATMAFDNLCYISAKYYSGSGRFIGNKWIKRYGLLLEEL